VSELLLVLLLLLLLLVVFFSFFLSFFASFFASLLSLAEDTRPLPLLLLLLLALEEEDRPEFTEVEERDGVSFLLLMPPDATSSA